MRSTAFVRSPLLSASLLALAALPLACSGAPAADTPVEAPPASSEQAIASSQLTRVPLVFHFLFDRIDPATGLPAYAALGRNETILDVDAAIARSNAILDRARGSDGRRLELVRSGVVYARAPSACPDPVTTIEPNRVYGALNVIMTSLCGGVATAAHAARADAGSLLHEVGHLLGLAHTFEGNGNAATVEHLYRERNPDAPDSCYQRGDYTCDTPPDYGYLQADGNTSWIVCGSLVPGEDLCTQVGPRCDPSDAVIDATGVCSNDRLGRGVRRYDPAALGLVVGRPGNVMAYHSQDFLTREQHLRMHGYAQWRLRVPARVPDAEKRIVRHLFWGPEPLWTARPNASLALANAQSSRGAWTHVGAPTLAGDLAVSSAQGRRVLTVRGRATFSGSLGPSAAVRITPPHGQPVVVPRAALRVSGGAIAVDEAFAEASPLGALRGRRAQGTWRIAVEDATGAAAFTSLSLEVVASDRTYLTNDRHASGFSDVLAYRASTGQLWISTNARTGAATFAAGVYDATAPRLGRPLAGDLDGDGAVDLVAWKDGALHVAFNEDSYATLHRVVVDGGDRPVATDELLVGDFDGDGFGDLMRRRRNDAVNRGVFTYYRGRGDGTFDAAQAPSLGGSNLAYLADATWTVGDFDGDGRSDIMVRTRGAGLFWISFNLTPRPGTVPTFYGGVNPTVGGSSYAYADRDRLVAMDVNGDGRDDIVVRRPGSGEWITSLNLTPTSFGGGFGVVVGGSTRAYLDDDVVLGALP